MSIDLNKLKEELKREILLELTDPVFRSKILNEIKSPNAKSRWAAIREVVMPRIHMALPNPYTAHQLWSSITRMCSIKFNVDNCLKIDADHIEEAYELIGRVLDVIIGPAPEKDIPDTIGDEIDGECIQANERVQESKDGRSNENFDYDWP